MLQRFTRHRDKKETLSIKDFKNKEIFSTQSVEKISYRLYTHIQRQESIFSQWPNAEGKPTALMPKLFTSQWLMSEALTRLPRSNSSRRLSVLRLPHRSDARRSGAQRRPSAQQLLQKALCAAPATQKARGGPRRPSAQQLLQKALCTAPATQKRGGAQRRPAATKRAAAPPEGSLYCACHTAAKRGPAAPRGDHTRSSSSRRLSVLRLPHSSEARPSGAPRRPSAQQLLQKALCTAPATQKARRAQLRPAATKRAETRPGGSLYCACHAKATARPSGAQRRPSAQQLLQEALYTAPATQKPPRGPAAPSGDQARSSSFRRLSVLHLPRKSNRAAQRRPAATKRAAAPSGGSLYCACHAKASAQKLLQEALCTAPATQQPPSGPAAPSRDQARSSSFRRLSVLRLPRKSKAHPSGAQRRPSAQKLFEEALCTAPATQKPPSGPAAPSGDQARRSSFRRLSVLRLPRKSQRAAQRRPAATKRAAAPSGGSLYCACHAKATARPSGAQRRPSAQQLLQEALCTAPAMQKPPRGPPAPSGAQARSSSFRRLSVLRLPRKSQRAAQRRPAATKCAAAPSGGSLYCACHAKAPRDEWCVMSGV